MFDSFFSESGGFPSAGLVLFLVALICGAPVLAQGWQRLGPPGGNVISLAAGGDGTVFLGTADGHIFASADRGDRWEIRGRVGTRLDGVVQRIVADQAAPGRLLAAVWYLDSAAGGGVFESTDGGWHWKPVGLSGEAVRALQQAPSNPQVWVAGTRAGVFSSSDNAHSWQRISPVDDPELKNLDSLAIDPRDPAVIYAGTYHLPWKTRDGGKSWTSIASGMIDDSDVMSLHIDSENSQRIFSSACSGIYRSEDGGATWVKLQGVPYASRRTQQIVQDPDESTTLYAATTEGLWQTDNLGESWKRIAPGESVLNAVLILRGPQGKRLLVGAELHGVIKSDGGSAAFQLSNHGFSHRVLASAVADRRDPAHLLVREGSAEARLLETMDGGKTWNEFSMQPHKAVKQLYNSASGWWVAFAEGGLAQFDPAKRMWLPAIFRETAVQLSAKNSRRKESAAPVRTARPRAVFPTVLSLAELPDEILAATSDGVWRKSVREPEFHRLRGKSLPPSVNFLAASEARSVLAVAKSQLWERDAVTWTWREIPAPGHSAVWASECLIGGSSLRLLGTHEGIFKAASGGPWRLLSSGLPAIPAVAAACAGSRLLAAMSNGGVYLSEDLGDSWQRIDTQQEQGTVTKILLSAANGFLVASAAEGLLAYSGSETKKQ